jgi:UDP-N-acetylmuramoyl-L-alanyl-D-glutamate--2,6-diaminopimelate ligase
MRLGVLLAGLPGAEREGGDAEVEISSVEFDSRSVAPGALFCAIRGERTDGHDHAVAAVEAGAAAVLAERPLPLDVPVVVVPDTRLAMAAVAVRFYGDPARALTLVGITGTNGKTTTTFLLRAVFEAAGLRADVLGTLSGTRTTPEAPELQARLAALRDDGVQAVAMEVSSHALDLHRVDGTWFAAAVFTNLSRDHLDYHKTMEAYFEAKARLFGPAFTDRAVVNLDSPYGRLLSDSAKVRTVGFRLDDAEDLVLGPSGSRFTWRGHSVTLSLGGRFNVANALAAAEAAVAVGIDPAVVAHGLSQPLVVPGRFELVQAGQAFPVVVDYAHTPDGLEQLLAAARDLLGPDGQVAVVFGCGGERDATKRPTMGEVAARLADRVVLTADNSRGEQTGAIIDAVRQGFDRATDRRAHDLVVEPDRRVAIRVALASAGPGDAVVIAGKGHESTQIIGDVSLPFDDRVVAHEELAGGLDTGSVGSVGPGEAIRPSREADG